MTANRENTKQNKTFIWMCNLSKKSERKTRGVDINYNEAKKVPRERRRFSAICAISSYLFFGFTFLSFGLLTTKYTLFEIALSERLEMKTFHPSYLWWKDPEPEVLLKVYIFNITNSEEFISGFDHKLKLQEVGPVIFQEKLEHKDVVFHEENSTLSYTVSRRLIFKESLNVNDILNQSVTILNMASLSGCSFVADSFLKRVPFNALLKMHKTSPVVTTTIYNYFFNLTEPVLNLTRSLVPSLVPTTEMGILKNIYEAPLDRVNVQIGNHHGNKNFFKINTWNYRTTVPRFHPEKGECDASIVGSNEGALYPQLITKDSVLTYWRKTLCRSVPLYFDGEKQIGKLKGYKFKLRENVYDRLENRTADCYKGLNLPDGLSDLSKCFFDQPIAASFPHFLGRVGNFTNRLEGINPNQETHESYAIIEPTLGVPLNQRATSQSNIVTKDLSGFKADIARFSNMVIPMFWLSVNMDEITPVIAETVNFVVNILPKIQFWISGGAVVFGLLLLLLGYLRLRRNETIEKKQDN